MRKIALLLIISLLVFTPLFPVRADVGVKVEQGTIPWERQATKQYKAMQHPYYHKPLHEITVLVADTGFNHDLSIFKNRKWVDPTGKSSIPGINCVDGGNKITSTNIHGTAVASVIAKMTPENVKIAGAMVFDQRSYASAFRTAIKWAIKNNIRIINYSLIFKENQFNSKEIQDALNEYDKFGGIVVTGAGNDSSNNDEKKVYPAGYENVISVAATNTIGTLAYFSNYGYSVQVAAPGLAITCQTKENSEQQKESGTSFAAPILTSLIAYIWSINPDLTSQQIKKIIFENCDLTDELFGKAQYGQINFLKTFNAVIGEPEIERICYKGKIIFIKKLMNGWQEATVNDMPNIFLQGTHTINIPGDDAIQTAKESIDYWYDKKMLNTECGCSQ